MSLFIYVENKVNKPRKDGRVLSVVIFVGKKITLWQFFHFINPQGLEALVYSFDGDVMWVNQYSEVQVCLEVISPLILFFPQEIFLTISFQNLEKSS